MELGQFVRIVEILVTSYCGIKLAVSPCKKRWGHGAVRWIFIFIVVSWNIILILNVFSVKAATVEYLMTLIIYFVAEYIFFRISFWKLLAQNLVYWVQLLLLREYCMFFCSMLYGVKVETYVYSDLPWHWIHLLMMVLTVLFSIVIYLWRKGKSFLQFRSRQHYIVLAHLLIVEYIIYDEIIYDERFFKVIPTFNYIRYTGLALILLLSFGIIFCVVMSYINEKYQITAIKNNYKVVARQYELIQEMYNEKRRQIHDSMQQNILIYEALKQGKTDNAMTYLENFIQNGEGKAICTYTGISVIDFMMNYKINEAKRWGIKVVATFDIYFCPFESNDMCVLLGNLFDNAIDAVKKLGGEEERFIRISMKTVNNTFMLRVQNEYYGNRKFVDGKYITTKKDKELHGIGLESAFQIVKKYDGYMEIKDDGEKSFIVVLSVYKKC